MFLITKIPSWSILTLTFAYYLIDWGVNHAEFVVGTTPYSVPT